MRVIDHLVLPVTTLTLGRSRLSALGFRVAGDAQHPFGTGNCCVYFANRTYLEPIAFVDRAAADKAASEGMFFVRRLKRFTEKRGEGFAMVALSSSDAEKDQAKFEAAGLSDGALYRFTRQAVLADGDATEIGVALAPLESPKTSDAAFFACQRIGTDALFAPEMVTHPNGVTGVTGVAAVAENPADFHILLSAATGQRELRSTSFALEADVDGALVAILTPDGFRARYGIAPPTPVLGLTFAAIDLDSADAAKAAAFAGSAVVDMPDRLVVPPAPGLGAALAYRKSNDA